MSRFALLFLCLTALVLGAALPQDAAAKDPDPEIEFNPFREAFMQQVGGQIKALKDDAARRRAAATSQGERDAIDEELREIRTLERRIDDTKMVESLYNSIKGGYKAIDDISKELERGFGKDSAINGTLALIGELGGQERMKQLSAASKLADGGLKYYKLLTGLRDDLNNISNKDLCPATRRFAQQITGLTTLMSNFGDKVPIIGAFIKGYGDVAGGLTKAVLELDGAFAKIDQDELRPGVHGTERGAMLRALYEVTFRNGTSPENAAGIPGLRDAYQTDCNRLVIWDREARKFHPVDDPSINAQVLRDRYAYFQRNGVPNPTPDQILDRYDRTVELTLEASEAYIEPGAEIRLTASARRVLGDAPMRNAYVRIALDTHSGFDAGTFLSPTEVRVGTPVRWKAPDSGARSFTFSATLEPSEDGLQALDAARAYVHTGGATRLVVTANPMKVPAGGRVILDAKLQDDRGQDLDANTPGFLRARADAGHFVQHAEAVAYKGIKSAWVAPQEPGTYTLHATYSGARISGLRRNALAAAEGEVTVEVSPAPWSLSIAPSSAAASPEEPATFTVSLVNEHDLPQRFEVVGGAGPAEQRAHWRTGGNLERSVTVEGGATHNIRIQAAPTSDAATRLQGELRARPHGDVTHRAVTFVATAAQAERAVSVRIAGTHHRATAGGARTLSQTLAPGTEIALNLAPWGPQREFCVTEVVERNRNMRQVELHSTGPNGCAWGTRNGRMSARWRVTSETATWSGPHVKAAPGSTTATFTVPDEPGTYTVTARGETKWSYVRNAPGGTARDTATDTASATFTVVVQ